MNPNTATSAEGIASYLAVLHKHRLLIADAYHGNTLTRSEENHRAISELQQHRALIPYLQDEFRLSPSLSRHLDEVSQRQRNYAVSSNFADQIERLKKLADECLKASHENRPEDRDNYEGDFDSGVFELGESISEHLLLLRTLTDNRFANVNTLAEKQRQNEYYIKQAEKLGEALSLLQTDAALRELLDSSTLLDQLAAIYQRQLLAKLPEWRANLLDITQTLRKYLYRLREVAPEARRLRNFAHFLKRNPDFTLPEVEALPHLPDWAGCVGNRTIHAHPDLSTNATREALIDVAASLPPAPPHFVRERSAGSRFVTHEAPLVQVLQAKPVQQAFQQYLQAAQLAEAPLSALDWKRQTTRFAALDEEAWLLYALHAVQMLPQHREEALRQLAWQRVEAPVRHPHDGNIVVRDIVLWKKP
ncbi:MAG: hypothetical protein WAO71_05225 [Gallionella sp.]